MEVGIDKCAKITHETKINSIKKMLIVYVQVLRDKGK
jgi:hypothetical protein